MQGCLVCQRVQNLLEALRENKMSAIRGKGRQQQEVGVTRAERRVANPPCAVNKTWNEEDEEAAAVSGRIGRVGKLDSMFHLADRLTQPGDHVTIVIKPPPHLPEQQSLDGGGGAVTRARMLDNNILNSTLHLRPDKNSLIS